MRKSRRARAREGVVLTLLLLQTLSAFIPHVSANSSPTEQSWLYQQFRFRREIVVSNREGTTLTNYPVLTRVDFQDTHLISSFLELRLLDQRGSEVPSYVVDERRSGDFVASILMLTFVSVVAAMVLFRAPTATSALLLWKEWLRKFRLLQLMQAAWSISSNIWRPV